MNKFLLLSQRTKGEGFEDAGPYEGVPEWLRHSLHKWIKNILTNYTDFANGYVLDTLERELRMPLGGGSDDQRLRQVLFKLENATMCLDIADYLLVREVSTDPDGYRDAEHLGLILTQANSEWAVYRSDGQFRLTKRLDPTTQELTTSVASENDRASKHLTSAYAATYGRDPNPSLAYKEAVRAVEAAARPVVTPNDSVATLGKMISAMADKPTKWKVSLEPEAGDPVVKVVEMMRLLWTGQLDRHGTDDDTRPLNVSKDAADAALHLAATLVQWFRSGVISRTE